MQGLSPQVGLHNVAAIGISSEVLVCQFGHHTSAWRTLDKSLHDQERLIDLLHRVGVLTDSCGNGRDTDRSTTKLVDDSQ